nr:hypothetical protein DM860_000603 [Ipomoea trifida]
MICDVALSLSRWLGSGWLDDIDDVGVYRGKEYVIGKIFRTLVAMIPVSLQVVKLRSRVNIFTDVRVHQLGDQVTRAKVYLLLCATTSNPHFMHVLKKAAASFAHGKRQNVSLELYAHGISNLNPPHPGVQDCKKFQAKVRRSSRCKPTDGETENLSSKSVRRVFKDMGGHHLSIHGRSSTVDGGWRRRQQQRTNELLSVLANKCETK